MPVIRGGNDDDTDKDWLFDFLLSVFKSPQWDVAVMGFIDENCAVFDNDEENKLAYTALYDQFKDLVETLCSTSLAEVGVAVEDFVEALEASRLSQDISTAVYEQLVALDDFMTFKKLMVKRNVELELEAVRALQQQGVPIQVGHEDNGDDGDGDDDDDTSGDEKNNVMDGIPPKENDKEPRGKGECKPSSNTNPDAARPKHGGITLDRQLRKAMDANLRELEVLHKREAVEQAELEQAIAMSLALETKRIEVEAEDDDHESPYTCSRNGHRSVDGTLSKKEQGGEHSRDTEGTERKRGVDDGERADDDGRVWQSKSGNSCGGNVALSGLAEAKCDSFRPERRDRDQEKLRTGGTRSMNGAKSLPPLSTMRGERATPFRGATSEHMGFLENPDQEAADRTREARDASEKARRYLKERQSAQDLLKVQADISEEQSSTRELHLKDLRDRIVRTKRAGREAEALRAGSIALAGQPFNTRGDIVEEKDVGGNEGCARDTGGKVGDGSVLVVDGERVEEDFADEQRRTMRVALARHMKRELIESEQDRLAKVQAEQLADLNNKLRLVARMRDENSDREADIARVLRQQQQQRARNMAKSAANAREKSDDYTFGEGG